MKIESHFLVSKPLRHYVVGKKYLPRGLGLNIPLMAGIYLKVFDAPTWGWAVFWTLAALTTIGNAVEMLRQVDCKPELLEEEQKP